MRCIAVTLSCAVVLTVCATQPASATSLPGPAAADTGSVQLPALRDTILAMQAADQAARKPLTTAFSAGQRPDSAAMAALVARLAHVDSVNLARLKAIVRAHGWPDVAMVGHDGAGAVFILVQHADRDVAFQKRYLTWLRKAFRTGRVGGSAGEAVALLTDRVRLHEGQPQLYGTQAEIQNGRLRLLPLQDSAHVDARRDSLGLPPLADYLKRLQQLYHLEH